MKIFMISTDGDVLREGSRVRRRMQEYAELVDELHIIVANKKEKGEFENMKLTANAWLYPVNGGGKLDRLKRTYDLLHQVVELYQRAHSDLLITSEDPFEHGFIVQRIAQKFNVAYQVQVHTDLFDPAYRTQSLISRVRVWIAKRVLAEATCIRVVSERIRAALLEEMPNLEETPITVLPIYVDTAARATEADAEAVHAEFPQFDGFVLLAQARLEPEKNIGHAIDAFRELVREHPRIGLFIMGEGSQRAALERRVKRNGIAPYVVFLGRRGDTAALFRAAEVALVTSRYEGYGRVFVEALTEDCPVISTDVGIAPELYGEEVGEYMCDPGDTECIANALTRFFNTEGERMRLLQAMKDNLPQVTYPDRDTYLTRYKEHWHTCLIKAEQEDLTFKTEEKEDSDKSVA